ncbi:angiotensin-converting enzyme-like [Maniola jurtina]|uniref:angiotensin-converting enzyme-like n=1 Tax=Maniola jurtina TaxID=191418 RepID=UPI001E68E2CF|nr:angiotensin-converting enzyme-like [Maniola jurtina]XP_045767658.1 angiotensin-converting enzyme-like [Maniola jurtina]XP_045767659.1 angiotensin-converting enzyme-like [Maniola jurtina]XP_045767660.1 angiotensin-converting enzyme-like [Maniola jurtina]XP_045767661.1 angiotensin-converting enzyme-like [Maniola jurtina]XP_045767662.1 angiotensin-converting enzyme-like [Maniola jurtina]XP_045767663.1 angiotensin-converting enzyme-like [Maniola jurtina]XP_045767664.1 angiotensin-converting e
MRPTLPLLCVCFYALLSSGTSSGDDRRWLVSLVDLVELDYQDHCDQRAKATWEELLGSSKGLSLKLERDKAFGIFARKQKTEVNAAYTAHSLSADDDVLRRRVKLLIQPGDTLLDTQQWIRLVTFGDTALNRLQFATDYDCGYNTTCTLRELQNNIARQPDEEILRRMKLSWENHLPDLQDYLDNILPLLRNASKENHYDLVEEYWDSLVEYEGATLAARDIWQHVQPLYQKLHKYVTLRLRGAEEVGKPLPVHLFRSLTGDDWSNLIESLLPKYPDIYQKVHANIQLKDIGGLNAYREANSLLRQLNLGEVPNDILTESAFNGTCPPTIVDWCQPNKLRFISCKDVSIQNYMDAHETATKIRFKITTALHSNNTYILREAPRYSAIYEAVPGFVSLLSLDPHTLDRAGLYPLERFNYNSNHHRLVLQLIIALRDLPKLNYYLAVDEWRLKVLMGQIPLSKVEDSWSEFRRNFSQIEPSSSDILGDPYVLFNKPYIGKFLGLILKYQIYQSFAEELISDDLDLITHVFQNNQRLIDVMMQGFSVSWPEMISDLLVKRENGLEYNALTDYFRLLDEYLDNQLDPASDHAVEDYNEPPPEVDLQENEIPEETSLPKSEDGNEKKDVSPLKTHDDILDNIIETDEDSNSKYETSTVGVLEIKNPVAAGDQSDAQNPKEASYNVYWWIGVAVALAVVVILVAIIARKRQSHRKQLEKQRRRQTA